MISILIFDPAETPGGSFSRAVELAAKLPEFNYFFLTYKPFDKLHSGAQPPHSKTVRLFSLITPAQAYRLQKKAPQFFGLKFLTGFIFRAILKMDKISTQLQARLFLSGCKIDLVQANNGIQFLPYHLSIAKKAKLIYYFRDLQHFAHLPKPFISSAEKMIFVGQKLFEQYQAQLNPPLDKCEIIHSPFDVYERLKHESKNNLDLPQRLKQSGNKIIVCSSRICIEKGQHVIIEAMKILASAWPKLTLLIVGEASKSSKDQQYLASLKSKIREYNLGEKVIFLGHRKNPLHILQYADIAVQAPTYFEALAGSLVEAVQLGIPTIGADIGGTSEVLKDGVTGFLFPPEDYQALADIINQLLLHPATLPHIIEQGKTYSLQKWSPKKISTKMRAIYSTARTKP